MICSIMQPTYIPWSGYFNQIKNSDIFVFLDDVQFTKQSWQSRNRISFLGQEKWLSIPIDKNSLFKDIRHTLISNHNPMWRKSHSEILRQAYSKSPYGREMLDFVLPLIEENSAKSLAQFNIHLISSVLDKIGVSTKIYRSSEVGCAGARSERINNICRKLDCELYLSPHGAKDYLEEDGFEDLGGVQLKFQEFKPEIYSQKKVDSFISHLSFVDVVANLGFDGFNNYIS